MDEKKKIDELFQKKFENFEAEAPDGSWEAIAGRLQHNKHKKRAAYWRWAGTAAAVVLAFTGGYLLNPGNDAGNYYDPRNHPVATYPGENSPENPTDELSSPETSSEAAAYQRPEEVVKAGRNTASPGGKSGVEDTDLLAARYAPGDQKGTADAKDVPEESISTKAGEENLPVLTEVTPFAALHHPPADSAEPVEAGLTQADLQALEDSLRSLIADLPTNDDLQKDGNARRVPGGFSVSALGGPALAFRNVDVKSTSLNANSPNSSQSFVAQNVEREKLSNSFSAGIDFALRGSGRIEYQAGVYLTQWRQEASGLLVGPGFAGLPTTNTTFESASSLGNMKYLNSAQSTDFAAVIAADSSTMAYQLQPEVQQQFSFVEIPLGVNYYLLDQRKWNWKLQGGISTRILAGAQSQFVYANGTKSDVENPQLNKLSLQLQAGTGVGYRLTNELQISLMPLLRYGLTPVNENQDVTTYFHQFMIYSGLSLEF